MIWFALFVVFCACFVAFRAIRGFSGDGFYVAGQEVTPAMAGMMLVIFLVAFGLFAAIQLGFIPNHAP